MRAELRQQRVLQLWHEGQTYAARAQALGVSRWTISRNVQGLLAQGPLVRPHRR
jgi:DNA-binding CsgD family transcriptional regulator